MAAVMPVSHSCDDSVRAALTRLSKLVSSLSMNFKASAKKKQLKCMQYTLLVYHERVLLIFIFFFCINKDSFDCVTKLAWLMPSVWRSKRQRVPEAWCRLQFGHE